MFNSLRPDFNLKRLVTFIAALWLQITSLIIFCGISSPQMPGPFLSHQAMSSASITPIYFQKDTIATPNAPEPIPSETHLAPEPKLSDEATSATEQEVNTQANATDGYSGNDDGQGLTPFPSWRMNAMPGGFTVMHHQIKTALPVFTPDPPILHGEVPKLARGKDVVLEVVIDDTGSIVQVEVLKAVGYGVEDSILQTLHRWIFVPAKVNGVAIASRRQLRFHFPG